MSEGILYVKRSNRLNWKIQDMAHVVSPIYFCFDLFFISNGPTKRIKY